jgi:hypothetical protein
VADRPAAGQLHHMIQRPRLASGLRAGDGALLNDLAEATPAAPKPGATHRLRTDDASLGRDLLRSLRNARSLDWSVPDGETNGHRNKAVAVAKQGSHQRPDSAPTDASVMRPKLNREGRCHEHV